MSLQASTKANLLLDRDPSTQKAVLIWSAGNPAFTDDMAEVILSVLLEDEGAFTTGRRQGPSLLSIGLDTTDAPSLLKGYAEQRLQMLVDDGRLKSLPDVQVQRVSRGQISVGVPYTTRAGRQDLVTVSLGSL